MTSCEAGNLPQKISSVSSDAQKKNINSPTKQQWNFFRVSRDFFGMWDHL